MSVDVDADDLLPDLPPLPAVGEPEETGPEGEENEPEALDVGDEERVDLDADEGEADVMDPAELIDAPADQENGLTEGTEAPGDELDAGPMVDAGDSEYGLTEGNETPEDPALEAGIDDLGEESLLTEDAGEEGLDDSAADLWRGEEGEDVAPGLRPLRPDPGEGDADDLDLGDDVRIDVPEEDEGGG